MKRLFVISLGVMGCVLSVLGQGDEKVVGYFNKHWIQVYDSVSEISYYRTAEQKGDSFLVREYNIAQVLKMRAECSAYAPRLIRNGRVIYYHDNGKIDAEGIYRDDKAMGVFHYFYKSGKPRQDLEYNGEDDVRYLQFFTETGQTLLANGNGVTQERVEAGAWYQEIENYRITASYVVTGFNDTIYSHTEREPRYRGGTRRLMREISFHTRYPRHAENHKREGTVYVSFVVTKSGRVEGIQIVKGFDDECELEAMRVVGKLNDWIPGRHKGKKVKVKYILPIKYKLKREMSMRTAR